MIELETMERSRSMESLTVPAHYLGKRNLCPGTGVVVPKSLIETILRLGQKAVKCPSCHITLIGEKPSN